MGIIFDVFYTEEDFEAAIVDMECGWMFDRDEDSSMVIKEDNLEATD